MIAPKSRAGRRRVPLARPLLDQLAAHRLLRGAPGGESLVFGGDRSGAFSEAVLHRARASWKQTQLDPIGLHECRHTYAAFMIDAGVNAKALSSYMGHSSITVTLDRYGHLMPGSEKQVAGMLSAYLEIDVPELRQVVTGHCAEKPNLTSMDDERPPICPVCGVTMVPATLSARETVGADWICLECEEIGEPDVS